MTLGGYQSRTQYFKGEKWWSKNKSTERNFALISQAQRYLIRIVQMLSYDPM